MAIKFETAAFKFTDTATGDNWMVIWTYYTAEQKFPWIANVYKNGRYLEMWQVRQAPTRSSSIIRIKKQIEIEKNNSKKPSIHQ
jgi:hypothetical protein